MSRLTWDGIGEKKFEYGVSMGVLFKYDATKSKWIGHPWNGLTNVTESPEGGDAEDFYADNIKYASLRGIESLSGSIECFVYPPEFEPCIGHGELANGIYIGQQNREAFAIAYRTETGDDTNPNSGYKLHFVYNCTANAAEMSHDTMEDSPSLEPMSFDFDSTPVAVTGHKPTSSLTIDSRGIESAKLTLIENAIYGTNGTGGSEGTESYLPMPDKILELIA